MSYMFWDTLQDCRGPQTGQTCRVAAFGFRVPRQFHGNPCLETLGLQVRVQGAQTRLYQPTVHWGYEVTNMISGVFEVHCVSIYK